jgi:hypothetical protein
MGRPRKPVDPTLVAKLARIGCTDREISGIVGMEESGVSKRFSDILRKSRETMRERLRRVQWKSAMKGNITMQIWLGKQMLGQADKAEVSGPNGTSLTVQIVNYIDRPNRDVQTIPAAAGVPQVTGEV